jgi:YfiH family protein
MTTQEFEHFVQKTDNINLSFSTLKDGPMNLVGHETFDEERRMNRAQFLRWNGNLKADQTVIPKTYHGARVEIVSNHNPIWGTIMADSIVTDKKGLALTMGFADCPTLALYDPVNEVIALVHCGWRPLSSGIIKNTFDKMRVDLNCFAGNFHAYIGPGICMKCYEVGPEVASKFGFEGTGKIHLDLVREIRQRLIDEGVNHHQIYDSGECTKCAGDGEKYFSFRRDKKDDPLSTGMAVLIMK